MKLTDTCIQNVRKPEGKRLLGRPRHRQEDNIKMALKGIEHEDLVQIQLAHDRIKWMVLVNMVTNLWVS
jgi:hypothetical protein